MPHRPPSAGSTWKRLRSDAQGTTVMEFGLIAAPFIALLLMILQFSLVFFAQEGLQTSTEVAGRLILTGQAQQQNMSASQFKTAVCKTLPPYLDCAKLMIDVRAASDFSSADTSRPTITTDASGNPTNSWSYDLAQGGGIVIVRLMYVWPVVTTPMGIAMGDISPTSRLLLSTTVSKAEYFS